MDLTFLPALNAILNGLAGVLLVIGVILIKQGRPVAHRRCMLSAFGVSTLFLICYLTHKIWKANTGQPLHTTYRGQDWLKGAYLFILMTHLVLAMVVPVLAIWLIRLGWTGRTDAHRRLARWTLPIWLYVSLTGVVIYLMLYHFNPPAPGSDPGNTLGIAPQNTLKSVPESLVMRTGLENQAMAWGISDCLLLRMADR